VIVASLDAAKSRSEDPNKVQNLTQRLERRLLEAVGPEPLRWGTRSRQGKREAVASAVTVVIGSQRAAEGGYGDAAFQVRTALMTRHDRSLPGAPHPSKSRCYWLETSAGASSPRRSLRGEHAAEVVIVGGGYTGLSAALHLAESFPEHRILLLEAARVGCGASGQNSGLVLPFIHGAEEIVRDLLRRQRVEEARAVYRETSAGIGIIEHLVGAHQLDCEWERVDCMRAALTGRQQSRLEREREMYEALGVKAEWVSGAALRPRVDPARYRGALRIAAGGMLHPGKLAREVCRLVKARGVEIHEESPALEILPGPTLTVRTPGGSVRAPALVLATNAYTAQLGMFRRRIIPIHSYSIATEPLSDQQIETLAWRGREPLLDARAFFELFRLTRDNRILHSGGDAFYCFNGAILDGADHPDYARLEGALRRTFPELGPVSITHRWVGHVGLTLPMAPTFGVQGAARNIYFAGGYSGHGVPVAFLAGRLLRDLYAGEPPPPALEFIHGRRLPPVPFEPLASIGFALYKRYLRWADSR
jgi:glycine/D-amino acid oxidase-like deaminating enzyme